MPEMKTTLDGMIMADNTMMTAINFPKLPTDVNNSIRDYFYLRYHECPTLENSPIVLRNSLSIACRVVAKQTEDLYNAYMSEYNPTENYRMHEETLTDASANGVKEDSETGSNKGTVATSANKEGNGASKVTETGNTIQNTNDTTTGLDTNSVSAYDTTKLAVHDTKGTKVNTNTDMSTENTSVNASKNLYSEGSEENVDSNGKYNTSRTGTHEDNSRSKSVTERYGNMGVTTTQQMLSSSVDLLQKLDFFEIVTDWIFTKSNAFYYYFT